MRPQLLAVPARLGLEAGAALRAARTGAGDRTAGDKGDERQDDQRDDDDDDGLHGSPSLWVSCPAAFPPAASRMPAVSRARRLAELTSFFPAAVKRSHFGTSEVLKCDRLNLPGALPLRAG